MRRYLVCLLLFPLTTFAQTLPVGWIDNSFGTYGSDTTYDGTITLLSVFSGDSIIAVGNDGLDALVVYKYDKDGHACASFGVNGSVHFHISGYNDQFAESVVVQPDGKILVGRYGGDTTLDDFLIARLMPDGSFDTSFNKTGILAADFDRLDNYLWNIALQPDGKILASGTTSTDTGVRLELVRFNGSGSIDSTFGTAGKVEMPLNAYADQTIYTTNNGDLSKFGAKNFLSLSTNDTGPNYKIIIDYKGLMNADIKPFLIRPVTGNLSGLGFTGPGGEMELLFGQSIPAQYILGWEPVSWEPVK